MTSIEQTKDYDEINNDELNPTNIILLSKDEQILKLIDVFYYIDNDNIKNDILNRINNLFDNKDASYIIICYKFIF